MKLIRGGRKGSEHKMTPTRVSFRIRRMWEGKERHQTCSLVWFQAWCVIGSKKDSNHEKHPRLCFSCSACVGLRTVKKRCRPCGCVVGVYVGLRKYAKNEITPTRVCFRPQHVWEPSWRRSTRRKPSSSR